MYEVDLSELKEVIRDFLYNHDQDAMYAEDLAIVLMTEFEIMKASNTDA